MLPIQTSVTLAPWFNDQTLEKADTLLRGGLSGSNGILPAHGGKSAAIIQRIPRPPD